MKRTIVLFAALFVAITACFAFTGVSKGDDIPIPLESLEFEEDTIFAAQPERARKWHFGADASMSVVPSFALNKHQQQYELGLSFGRTLTPFFHLGLGASYVFYSGFADGLPVWINPRVYFSRNVSSMFLDFRIGGMVYSPKKIMDERLIRASVGPLSFGEITLGYQIKEHVMMGIYVNSYGVDEWQREGKWLDSEQPYAIGLKFGYEF